jgi:hypothetical protein
MIISLKSLANLLHEETFLYNNLNERNGTSKVWVLKPLGAVIEIRGSCHFIYQFQTFEAIQVPQVPHFLQSFVKDQIHLQLISSSLKYGDINSN